MYLDRQIGMPDSIAPAHELADELVVEAGAAVQAEGVDGAVGDRGVGGCSTDHLDQHLLALDDHRRRLFT